MPTTTFKEVATGSGANTGRYVWSLAANWTNGIPASGYSVTYTASGTSTDFNYDDIDVTLSTLALAATVNAAEFLDITHSMTVAGLTLTKATSSNGVTLDADSISSGLMAKLTITGSIVGQGTLEASGGNASVIVNAADPGNMIYLANQGGLIYLQNAPTSTSIFQYVNASSVFAFANPGATVGALLQNASIGDGLELPGTMVISATFGLSSIKIVTDAGAYNFTNVTYLGGIANDYSTSADFSTGLEKITLLTAPLFLVDVAETSGGFTGGYLWNKAANWSTNSVPTSGDVILPPSSTSTPTNFIDSIASMTIDRIAYPTVGRDFLSVTNALTVGQVQFGVANQVLIADSLLTGGTQTNAALTINGLSGVAGMVSANGSNAIVYLNTTDPGETYTTFNSGAIALHTTPNAASHLNIFQNGTLFLYNPGLSVGGMTTIASPISTGLGSTLELPGSVLISSGKSGTSETFTTDVGTYVFSHWSDAQSTDFVAQQDFSTGLLKIGVTHDGAANNPQINHDLNGDGSADIIFQNSATTQTAVWEMTGTTMKSASFIATPGGTWRLVAAGDFNGDGKSDLLLQDGTGNLAEWLMNSGSVTSGIVLANPGASWTAKTTGDFNNDGVSDIAFQNTDGSIAVWEMNGGSIIANGASVLANPGAAWHLEGTGDFWGDGKSELLFQNDDGSLAIWGMNASPSGPVLDPTHTTALGPSLNPGSSWRFVATGDFNSDGKSDLAFQNTDGSVAIWMMNGASLATAGADVLGNPGAQWQLSQVGDLFGFETSDLVFQNSSNGQIQLWTIGSNETDLNQMTLGATPGSAWKALT